MYPPEELHLTVGIRCRQSGVYGTPIVARRRRNPLEACQLLERFDQSGLSAAAFAKNEEGLA
jgi:hypothetical protein